MKIKFIKSFTMITLSFLLVSPLIIGLSTSSSNSYYIDNILGEGISID